MEPQFTSARQVSEHAEQERKKQAEIDARFRAQEVALQRRRQIEEDRNSAQIEMQRKRDLTEEQRHQENRRLTLMAIAIAGVSAVISVIAIFK